MPESPPSLVIRPAGPTDVETLHRFVVDLAADESFPGEVEATPESLRLALLGERPLAEAVLATVDSVPVGFALFYLAYSTVTGRPTLHLEDLYVVPNQRGSGTGLALLRHLAGIAYAGGHGRFEWWVLRTNVDAIRFYHRLGARAVDEISVMRLDGAALDALAAAGA